MNFLRAWLIPWQKKSQMRLHEQNREAVPKHSLPPQEQILSYTGRFINCPYGTSEKRPSPFLYSSALLSSFGALVSIKNAPSGAVMTMPSTATDSTMLPQGSPAASGTEPMAACTVALGR